MDTMSPLLMTIEALANAVIVVAYASIPIFLIVVIRKRRDIPFSWVVICFGAFILACSFTHVMHIVALWHPMGWGQAAVDIVCAVISLATAILVWPLLPKVLAIPSPAQLRALNRELRDEKATLEHTQGELRRANAEMERRVQERTADLARANESLQAEIREHQRAEATIKQLNAELEQRVLDRTTELQAANRELESFCYSVSHDLRAPLRHITGFSDMLTKGSAASLDDRGRHQLDVISESAARMTALIDDLLAFSRMGRAELRRERVALDALVGEIIEEAMSGVHGRRVVWQIDPLPSVSADPILLRAVLTNLISNALKFTGKREEAVIRIGCIEGEREQVFFVRDNGVGFDMAYADKLFGVFQRLHSAEEFEGTGIGLANVQRIVHRHGGRVWAESVPDEGATFSFSLPVTLETEA